VGGREEGGAAHGTHPFLWQSSRGREDGRRGRKLEFPATTTIANSRESGQGVGLQPASVPQCLCTTVPLCLCATVPLCYCPRNVQHENVKKALLLQGTKSSALLKEVLTDIHHLKRWGAIP